MRVEHPLRSSTGPGRRRGLSGVSGSRSGDDDGRGREGDETPVKLLWGAEGKFLPDGLVAGRRGGVGLVGPEGRFLAMEGRSVL